TEYRALMECLKVRIPADTDKKVLNAVCSILKYFDGTVPVYIYHAGTVKKGFRVSLNNTLINELQNMLGSENVKQDKVSVKDGLWK
ncbi:MAG TPA: hypothetical protein VIL89_09340, partial [Clostridia bacterium]